MNVFVYGSWLSATLREPMDLDGKPGVRGLPPRHSLSATCYGGTDTKAKSMLLAKGRPPGVSHLGYSKVWQPMATSITHTHTH